MEGQKSYMYEYPYPAVTSDIVVFGFDGQDLKVLLIQRGIEPFKGRWALPGGFMHEDETIEACAVRELYEETHLKLTNLKQLQMFSNVNRDPRGRVVTMAFYALVRHQSVQGGDDARQAQWFPIEQLPELAFDHADIIQTAILRIRKDIHFEPIGFDLLDETFTIPQLQRLYEVVLNIRFDRRNFQKKMIMLGLIKQIDKETADEVRPKSSSDNTTEFFGDHQEMRKMDISVLFGNTDKRGRKPNLFCFNKQKYDELKSNHNFRLEF